MFGKVVIRKKPRKKVVKKPAAHPPFAKMVFDAIVALKERNGSSRQAILKYIVANNKGLNDNAKLFVNQALKKGIASKALKAGAADGRKGSGCFKIGEVPKAPKKKVVKKKPAAKKVVKKKPAAKKPAAKKPAAKKPAAKKPAAKKPAAKKPAKKAAPKKK